MNPGLCRQVNSLAITIVMAAAVLLIPVPGQAAECRDPGVYGKSLDAMAQCRTVSGWRWLSFFSEDDSGNQSDDPRSFVCLEGRRGADAEVAAELEPYCRTYDSGELAPLAANPARAVDKVGDLVASFAWGVQPGGQAARDLWGDGGVLSSFMDARAFGAFRASRQGESWTRILDNGVEQIPVVDGTPESVVIPGSSAKGEAWRWRHVRSLKFIRVERDPPALGVKALPPPRLINMTTRVSVALEGRFDPRWAGDANPLGLVVEMYEETVLAGDASAPTPRRR